ncbi:MAG: BamA/TamA family outer membrane protein, partial [Acidobacteriota bacterium]
MDYDAVQHLPILREAWVLSFHGHLAQTDANDGQEVPYFMRPWLGGGTTLRGIDSFRFRDRNSLLLQAEWRIMVNRFMETAAFYDAGKVAAKVGNLSTRDMAYSYGFGFRVHTPYNTALRVDLAKSPEGFAVVFASGPVF